MDQFILSINDFGSRNMARRGAARVRPHGEELISHSRVRAQARLTIISVDSDRSPAVEYSLADYKWFL